MQNVALPTQPVDFMIPHAKTILIAVTDLGDSLVLSGIVLITTIYLIILGCRRSAFILLGTFLITGLTIALLKMFFFSCHQYFSLPDSIHSPSGHAALTTVVWGVIASLIAAQYSGWRRRLTIYAATALISGIAVTRWALHFHTANEIVTGLLVGLLGLTTAHALLELRGVQKFDPRGLIVATLAAALILNGFRLPAEGFMQIFARKVQSELSLCMP